MKTRMRRLPPLRSRLLTLCMIGAVSLVVTAAWRGFLENFDRRIETARSGFGEAALRNPFLGLEFLLRELGYRADSIAGRDKLIHLPGPADVLVVNNAGPALAPDRQAALLDWLDCGGHLVIAAGRLWDSRAGASGDRLLDELGVELHQLDAPARLERVQSGSGRPALARFAGDPAPIRIGFDADRYLVDRKGRAGSGVAAPAAKDGYHLLQIPIGRGLVTVTSDNGFLKNAALGEFDHAYYAAALLGPPGTAHIWLLYDSTVAPLAVLIWKKAPALVISAGVLIAAAAFMRGLRFGPVRGADPAARRDLTQHLDAAARFLWRGRERARLVGGSRIRVVRAWTSRHPEFARLEQRELAAAIAGASDEQQAAVELALDGHIADEAGLIAASRALQRLALKGPRTELHQECTS